MKTYALLCACLLLRGSCAGPDIDSNFELNNADGQYIMTALIDAAEGKEISIDAADEKRQVHVKRIIQSPFNNGDSTFPGKGYFYQFRFSDLDGRETALLEGACESVKKNKKFGQESQWLILNDSTGMLVVLERDIGRGVTTRLMISNIMKSSVYKKELDKLRYIYRPKFN
jgi:hypothetical protein